MSQAGIIDIEGSNPQIPTSFITDDGVAIPIGNTLEILGETVPNATFPKPLYTTGSGNTVTVNVQVGSAITGAPADNNDAGVVSFDDTAFAVDANGFVTLIGGGTGIESVITNVAGPVTPDGAGQISILGDIVPAIGIPLKSDGSVANVLTMQAQVASSQPASSAVNAGMASFDNTMFTVDSNGFVTLIGGSEAIDSIGVDATSGGGTNPVLPTIAGLVTVNGARVAAGTNPVRSVSTAANVYQIQVQTTQALAATDATKVGLANFNSSHFSVDANGFVSSIAGGFPWSDVSGAFSPLAQNGYFVTGTATGTLPASPVQGDTIQFFLDHASQTLTLQATGTQIIRLNTSVTAAAGTAAATGQGSSIELVYRASNTCWCSVDANGNWILT